MGHCLFVAATTAPSRTLPFLFSFFGAGESFHASISSSAPKEHKSLSFALPPYFKDLMKYDSYRGSLELTAFDIMGVPVSARLWAVSCTIFTALDYLDVVTDAAYAGTMFFGGRSWKYCTFLTGRLIVISIAPRVSGADICSQGRTDALWQYWWRHSAFGFIPCFHLDQLCLASLLLSSLQIVIPLVTCWRFSSLFLRPTFCWFLTNYWPVYQLNHIQHTRKNRQSRICLQVEL